MCRTVYFKSTTCGHRWVIIGQPCDKDPGFDKCKMLNSKKILPYTVGGPIDAMAWSCPVCDKKNKYDGNLIRMVSSDSYRWRFGFPTERKRVPKSDREFCVAQYRHERAIPD